MKVKIYKGILLFWTLFIGLGAVYGGTSMLVDPSGAALSMEGLLPDFQVLPFADVLFSDYTFPGIALLIVNGATQLTAFIFLIRKAKSASLLSLVCGILLMAWICIQFVIFEFNFLSTSFFVFGALEALFALLMRKSEKSPR